MVVLFLWRSLANTDLDTSSGMQLKQLTKNVAAALKLDNGRSWKSFKVHAKNMDIKGSSGENGRQK